MTKRVFNSLDNQLGNKDPLDQNLQLYNNFNIHTQLIVIFNDVVCEISTNMNLQNNKEYQMIEYIYIFTHMQLV